jgi:hypothetical protein
MKHLIMLFSKVFCYSILGPISSWLSSIRKPRAYNPLLFISCNYATWLIGRNEVILTTCEQLDTSISSLVFILQIKFYKTYLVRVRPRLHCSQNRHNTTVWTDSRKDINRITVCQRYTENDPTGKLSSNNGRLSCANKVGLFRADSLARYLLQCA